MYLYGDMTIMVVVHSAVLGSVTCPLLLRQGMGSSRADYCGVSPQLLFMA